MGQPLRRLIAVTGINKLPPEWTPTTRHFPSGPRKVYVHSTGRIAQSLPQVVKMDQQMAQTAPFRPPPATPLPPAEKSHPDILLSPKLICAAAHLHISASCLKDNGFVSRLQLISDPNLPSPFRHLRDAAQVSLLADLGSQPLVHDFRGRRLPVICESVDERGDREARTRQWMRLRDALPDDCFINMCGGQEAYNNTPPDEAARAIMRKALMAAGTKGQSFARDFSTLQRYHQYRSIKGITTPPWPCPPAVAANCAEHYMLSSAAYAEGGARSIGPGIMASFEHMRRHLGLPITLDAPVADSIPRAPSSSGNKAGNVPLWLCDSIEGNCDGDEWNPFVFYNRMAWLCIITSLRNQELWRMIPYRKYNIPRASVVVEVPVVKNGDQHVVIALSSAGFSRDIEWLPSMMRVIEHFGFSSPAFEGNDLRSSKRLLPQRVSDETLGNYILRIYALNGLSEDERKDNHITKHSGHGLFDNIGTVLQWSEVARADLGRWKQQGGQGCMHHRYATKASAINQMYIRATVLNALRDICPPPFPRYFDLEHIRASPFYDKSIYTGQFVTFSIQSSDGDIKIDDSAEIY